MANTLEELTQRVARLEQIIEDRFPQAKAAAPRRDWRDSIGIITDDAITEEIIAAGLRLREEERAVVNVDAQ